jgi:hypothetical protein
MDSEKKRYELTIARYKDDKKKLTKLCKVFEETLNKKENELNQSKNALQELQLTFQHVQQKLVRP